MSDEVGQTHIKVSEGMQITISVVGEPGSLKLDVRSSGKPMNNIQFFQVMSAANRIVAETMREELMKMILDQVLPDDEANVVKH